MLNVHSQFSLRYGLVAPCDLIPLLREKGYERFALTDINSSSAVLGFVRDAQEAGHAPSVGIDFRNGIEQQFIGLAKNNRGFNELNIFLSRHLHDDTPFPDRAPHFSNCFVVYPWKKAPQKLLRNERIGVAMRDINRLVFHAKPDDLKNMVILQPMTFRHKRDYNTHRLLRAIDRNSLLSLLPESEQASQSEAFISRDELYNAFKDYPQIIRNTEELLARCDIQFAFGEEAEPQNLATYTGSRDGDRQLLRTLVGEGIKYRFKEPTAEVLARIEKELDIIDKKNYLSYFLITWDIVNYARSKEYFYVGRGSGANSLIAYLLRITDVDPIQLDLYFERFINLFRKNPPDFDMDFSWQNREDVTRYIFETFPSAALVGTYNTFQFRASVREIGKVFGLAKTEIDKLSDGNFAIDELDHLSILTLKYAGYIDGLPSIISVHSSGILISEKPITWYSGTFLPPKGYRTVQFSMLEAEDVGLYKFDVLAQRGLAKIQDTIEIIKYNQPENPPHDIHDMEYLMQDEGIKEILREGKALGCFYVESPAMRNLLLKLKVEDYLTLVAASSIIRPGVSKSGMMHEYIRRHMDEDARKKAHPTMLQIMPETYGVMVYQEDVIKVAHEFAGLNLAEADVLRRGMSGKFRSRQEFQRVQEKFFSNCEALGHAPELTAEIWRQIESFAGYSFSKGHSASYAVESYQALYLKRYYPLEYMVATLNNGGGFYSVEIYVHEARMYGGKIESPSVNYGSYETIIYGDTIYLGFHHVKDIEEKTIKAVLRERFNNGRFKDFDDLVRRIHVPLDQLWLIIKIGGLRDLGDCKKTLLWKAQFHLNKRKEKPVESLFYEPAVSYELPPLYEHPLEQAFEELELLGFPLSNVFNLLAESYTRPTVTAKTLSRYVGQTVDFLGYLVHVKHTSTTKLERMHFGTFLDIEGEHLDTVHFPQAAQAFPFRGKGIYHVRGVVMEEFGVYTIQAQWQRKLRLKDDVRFEEPQLQPNHPFLV